MSREATLRRTAVLAGGLIVAGYFQNCAPPRLDSITDESDIGDAMVMEIAPFEEPPSATEKTAQETVYEPVLADRYYLKSLIDDVFGPSAPNVASTRLFRNAVDHGSPCSFYEGYNIDRDGHLNDDGISCGLNSPSALAAHVNPKATVTRQALLSRACSDLVTNGKTFAHALKRISDEPVPSASRENLLRLFHLFYRLHPSPHEGLIDALQVMFSSSAPSAEEWRPVILTVCLSSHWQVL